MGNCLINQYLFLSPLPCITLKRRKSQAWIRATPCHARLLGHFFYCLWTVFIAPGRDLLAVYKNYPISLTTPPSRSLPNSVACRHRCRGPVRHSSSAAAAAQRTMPGLTEATLREWRTLHRLLGKLVMPFRMDAEYMRAAGRNFFYVAYRLFEQVLLCRQRDDRDAFFDQGQRSVLQLSGCISLGVNIRNLLQLQGAFQSYSIIEPRPMKNRLSCVAICSATFLMASD